MSFKEAETNQELVFFIDVICNQDRVVAKEFFDDLTGTVETLLSIPDIEYDRFAKGMHNIAGSCGLMGFHYWSIELMRLERCIVNDVTCLKIKLKVKEILVDMMAIAVNITKM